MFTIHKLSKNISVGFLLALVACGGGESTSTGNFTGTVSNLKGELTLEINNGQPVTIRENGKFDFTVPIKDKAEYKIRVKNEPCEQRCDLDSYEGTFDQDKGINVTVTCEEKSWSDSPALNNHISLSGSDVEDYEASMNRYGDFLFAWQQNDEAEKSRIYLSEYKYRNWTVQNTSRADFISFNDTESFQPSAHISNIESFVAWTQENNSEKLQGYINQSSNDIWITLTGLNDGLGMLTLSESDVANNQDIIVRMSEDGSQGIAVWTQDNGSHRSLYIARYASSAWTRPESLDDNYSNSDAGDTLGRIDAAVNNKGDIIVVWEQQSGSYTQIFKAEKRSSGWLNSPEKYVKVSSSVSDAHYPKVALNEDGDTIIVWQQADTALPNDESQIFRTSYEKNNENQYEWSSIEKFSRAQRSAIYPQVAINNENYAVISWQEEASDGYDYLYLKDFKNGSWAESKRISPLGSDVSGITIGIDDEDQGAVVWSQDVDDVRHVFISELNDGKWLTLPNLLNALDRGKTEVSSTRVLVKNCRKMVTWIQDDGESNSQLYMMQYQ